MYAIRSYYEYVIIGIGITILIYFGRIIVGKITLTKRFSLLDRKVTYSMIPRGLAAAVLATFPLTLGLPNAEIYSQIVFFIILSSVITSYSIHYTKLYEHISSRIFGNCCSFLEDFVWFYIGCFVNTKGTISSEIV